MTHILAETTCTYNAEQPLKAEDELAELSRQTGISKNALSDLYYEKTDRIRFETLDKICKALNCSVADLLEFVPDKQE